MDAQQRRRVLLVCVFSLVAAISPTPVATAGTSDVLTVDGTGEAEFTSIQAAVDAADQGDTIRVRPGTYRENVTVDVAVRIVAPRGARLDGSTLGKGSIGFKIRVDERVVVDGFTITSYAVGVDADGTAGAWVVRNTSIRNTDWKAVSAGHTSGNWHVDDVSIINTENGIVADSSTGEWRVTDTTIRNVTQGNGVDAMLSTGGWLLDDVTIREVGYVGVSAPYSRGDWRILNTTIRETTVGISAVEAAGNWTVLGSTIANSSVSERYDFWRPPLKEGVGVYAPDTNGSWEIHRTRFVNNSEGAVVANGANPAGNATRNWWDETSATDRENCIGNVDCSHPLPASTPAESPVPTSATPGDTTTDTRTTTRTSPSRTESTPTDPQRPDFFAPVPGGSLTLLVGGGLLVAALFVGSRCR